MINVFNELKSNHGELLESSIINPIYGFLFESMGCTENIRFYSPDLIESSFRREGDYSSDYSKDPLTKSIIELFPSTQGILSTNSDKDQEINYKKYIKSKDVEGIKFLADLFVNLLEGKETEHEAYDKKADNIFNKVASLILMKTANPIFKDNYIKLMIIHSYAIHIFNTEEQLKMYLTFILNQLSPEMLKDDIKISQMMEKVEIAYKKSYLFPYSPTNKPPSNIQIPIYDREKDEFSSTATFPDCADVLLLNICNCLFYDTQTYEFSLVHLQVENSSNKLLTGSFRKDCRLAEFYKKNKTIFKIDMDIRKEWSRVVQGLDDFEPVSKDKYNTHLLVYKREYRNEIKSGIINMMNMLIRICAINHNEFWKGFNGKHLGIKLKELLNCLTLRKEIVNVVTENFYQFESMNRTDFTGYFNISVNLSNLVVKLRVRHEMFHAEMEYVTADKRERLISSNKYKVLESERLPELIFKRYLMMDDNDNDKLNVNNIFSSIFVSGPIKTNVSKIETLSKIFRIISHIEKNEFNETEKKKLKDVLKSIITHILKSIALNDDGTRSSFRPFLAYNLDLVKDDKELIECWIRSFKVKHDIHEHWAQHIITFNSEEIDIDLKKFPVEKTLLVFDALEQHKHLKRLRISGVNFDKNMMGSVISFMENAAQLVELEMPDAIFTPDGSIKRFKWLKPIPNLKSLNISNTYSDFKGLKVMLSVLVKMKGLKNLTLSGLNMGSYNKRNDVLLNTLGELSNLEYLDIRENNFDDSFIQQILETNKNLNIKWEDE